jgi:2-keto-4-pentenoate hydratase
LRLRHGLAAWEGRPMEASLRDDAARWLAEAIETGAPLAPLPPMATPRSMLDGQRIAARVLEMLAITPCGLRLASPTNGRPVPGPVLEERLLKDGSTLSLTTLRHPRASAAVVGVLGEDLHRRGDDMPIFAVLHPAIDVGSWRLREPPSTGALAAADLGGLGFIVTGKPKRMEPMRVRVSMAPAGTWRRGEEVDLEETLLAVALAARRAGGLPQGALLVAQLGESMEPEPGLALNASFGRLGRVTANFVA